MAFKLDLSRYFARIGYAGASDPTLSTLNGIVEAHVRSIPFENLDVLLGKPIAVSPESIERKLVHDQRGGYCFEQNTLLLQVLEALGYVVTALSARVRLQRPRDVTPPRTHMFLRVELDGASWIADVGVGALSLTSAVRLAPDITQATPHEPRRIVREGRWSELGLRGPEARLFHQAYFADTWNDVCDFTLEEMPLIDRETGSWFASTHPASIFKSRLIAARATADGGRLTLLNRDLLLRHRDGTREVSTIATPTELLAVLEARFGLTLPRAAALSWPGLDWSKASPPPT